ncbi:iron-containing redox enzyme family protein [Mycobacterium sp. MYCO198283]|uniref:iron-containing redox enzyme family protein n=1 Tax=Mycobacterium sp. MYCO198283 TaxID=2883505 RepID=UPI001E5C7969|nr:iron-containing redox enzyme family protein [Mycobacterium sp. MYCO198283]MCG5432831.1 iron-containing redox enzyme family protein [Mycobacterium sp. MYCO198283]
MTLALTAIDPALPTARGPISAAVLDALRQPPGDTAIAVPVADADPWGQDLQLALYVLYELHYRGFAGVDADHEWNPELLRLRRQLEAPFEAAVRAEVGDIGADERVDAEMDGLCVEPADGNGPSYYLRDRGTWDQLAEYFVHRSVYHLKEADPHAWAIPRLVGHAKAAFVAIEFDEFGGGRGDHVHQQLYSDLLEAAGLNSAYLAYLDAVPAESLAVVNLMSLFGLHRRLRGATVGHFAAVEITSSPGSRRLVEAMERLDAPEACKAFYAEHVVADAVHEQVVRTDVVGDLIAREPQLERDVIFGIRACDAVENRLAAHLLDAWTAGRSSLRRPLT